MCPLQARQSLSALRQHHHNSSVQPSDSSRAYASATTELLRIKDHLIDVEKSVRASTPEFKELICCGSVLYVKAHQGVAPPSQNASLVTESSLLKEQLKQLENQNTSLNSQMVAQQRHTSTLQEQNSGLHTQTAKLQVDLHVLPSPPHLC